MNDIAESAQNIKRFLTADMPENKATGIWEIFGIDFNNFTLGDHMLDLGKSYAAAIAASLAMPCNLKFTAVDFPPDLFKHCSSQRITRWLCAVKREFIVSRSFALFSLTIS